MSGISSVSPDGRFVAYGSTAFNMVSPAQFNQKNPSDVFLVDRENGLISTLISIGYDGKAANGPSGGGSVSADGRFVAFESAAKNLVPGVGDGFTQLSYLRDVKEKRTFCANLLWPVSMVTADGPSYAARINAKGTHVAFLSEMSNAFSQTGDSNGVADLFVRPVYRSQDGSVSGFGPLVRASVDANGELKEPSRAFSLSGDGSRIAFQVGDSIPVIHVRDWKAQKTIQLIQGAMPAMNLEGTAIALGRKGLNGFQQVYFRKIGSPEESLVSHAPAGNEGIGDSSLPSFSGDRYIAFASEATNLITNESNVADVFRYDLWEHKMIRISLDGNGGSLTPKISQDGSVILFTSWASDHLPPGEDTNGVTDVFAWGWKK